MRTTLCLAALAVGGLVGVQQLSAQNAPPAQPNVLQRTADRLTGTTRPALAPDADNIRDTLQEVTNASLTKGGFDDLVERFVDADRNRLGKDGFPEKDLPQLDGRIAQFQKDWQSKYNQEFKIKDKEAVYTAAFAMIIQSEIADSARLAGERTAVTETGNTTVRDESRRVAGGDTNLEKGRNVATVTIASSHGLPELRVPMIREAGGWKIDISDTYSAQQLHDNLLKHLTMVNEARATWPADANEAYRLVSHHLLMAVMNVDSQGRMPTAAPATPATPVPNRP